ncbi:MAG: ethanolamine ammonia-lyase subunit EutB, partial [Bacillota bacterium]|nr:ethanolamine ammonia-lyase subunit EutB [Bacillota bacterium]
MQLNTKLNQKVYHFTSVKEVLAKANEEKSGDQLAGLAAS